MSDSQTGVPDRTALDQERLLVALSYGLYLIGVAGGISIVVGFIIALVRKSRAQGTICNESHYRNLILVFFVMLGFGVLVVVAALAAGLNLLMGGQAVLALWQWPFMVTVIPAVGLCSLLLGIWFFWRVLRGFIRVLDEKPY